MGSYDKLMSPEAVRSRKLMALSQKNPVIKVKWEASQPKKGKKE